MANNNIEETHLDVAKLLNLIESCTYTIEMRRKAGESEDSLGIRQDKHQRQRFLNDLNELLKNKHLKVELTE